MDLQKVRYVLISVSKLSQAGFDVHFEVDSCTIEKNGQVVCYGVPVNHLVKLLEMTCKILNDHL